MGILQIITSYHALAIREIFSLFWAEYILNLPVHILLLSYAMILITGHQIWFYIVRLRLKKDKKRESKDNLTGSKDETLPISLIIIANNKSNEISKNLPAFLKQKYDKFEIIFVDNRSEDDTPELIKLFQIDYPNLKYTNIPKDSKSMNRKLAYTIGIRMASFTKVMLISIGGVPSSDQWLSFIAPAVSKSDVFIAPIIYERGTLAPLLMVDTLFQNLITFSSVLQGLFLRGYIENIGMDRDMFLSKGCFPYQRYITGEDDLLVQHYANRDNCKALPCLESSIILNEKNSFESWIFKRCYRAASLRMYSFRKHLRLSVHLFSQLFSYLVPLVLILLTLSMPIVIFSVVLFLLRTGIVYYRLFSYAKRFKESFLRRHIILYDVISPFLQLMIFFKRETSRSHKNWI